MRSSHELARWSNKAWRALLTKTSVKYSKHRQIKRNHRSTISQMFIPAYTFVWGSWQRWCPFPWKETHLRWRPLQIPPRFHATCNVVEIGFTKRAFVLHLAPVLASFHPGKMLSKSLVPCFFFVLAGQEVECILHMSVEIPCLNILQMLAQMGNSIHGHRLHQQKKPWAESAKIPWISLDWAVCVIFSSRLT